MSVTVAGPPPVGNAVKCMSFAPGDSRARCRRRPTPARLQRERRHGSVVTVRAGAAFTSSAVTARMTAAMTTSTEPSAASRRHLARRVGDLVVVVVVVVGASPRRSARRTGATPFPPDAATGTDGSGIDRHARHRRRSVAEAPVHDLAAERGGDDQRREHDQLDDEDAAVVGALQRVEAADLAPRLVRADTTSATTHRARARRSAAAPRAARRRRVRGSTTATTAPRARRASTPSPPTCTSVGRDREPGRGSPLRACPAMPGVSASRADERRRADPPPRQRVRRPRAPAQQHAQQRERDHEQREPHQRDLAVPRVEHVAQHRAGRRHFVEREPGGVHAFERDAEHGRDRDAAIQPAHTTRARGGSSRPRGNTATRNTTPPMSSASAANTHAAVDAVDHADRACSRPGSQQRGAPRARRRSCRSSVASTRPGT